MAFLSKILFKLNKVLEILLFVSIYYAFKFNEHGSIYVTCVRLCKCSLIGRYESGQTDAHYSSLLNEDSWYSGAQ